MTTAAPSAVDQISRLNGRWADAIRAKDLDGALANYAADVLSFDLIDPLQYAGVKTVRQRLQDWFSSFDGPIGYDTSQMSITAGDTVAFAHSLNHVHALKKDGQPIDMWWRSTVCYRKMAGEWTVTHSHSSVPFDMHSGAASLGLQP